MAVEMQVVQLSKHAMIDNPDGYTIVMGDLQEEYDGPFLTELKELGLESPHVTAAQCDDDATSHERSKGFATRFPPANSTARPTAIDWILVCPNCRPYVHAAGIDTGVFKYIVSDHALTFLDLSLPIRIERLDDHRQPIFKFRTITNIKVHEAKTPEHETESAEKEDLTDHQQEDREEHFTFDQTQFKSPQVIQDEEIYNTLQDKVNKHVHASQIDNLQQRLDTLQNKLVAQAQATTWTREVGQLPPRDPDFCNELNSITEDLTTAIEKLMRDMKLAGTTSIRKSIWL